MLPSMMFKIMCLCLCGLCQCGLHAVLWWLICMLVPLLAAETRRQYRWIFIPISISLWNDLGDPVFDGVGLEGFKSRENVIFYRT